MNNENNGPNHSVTLSIASTSSSSKWSTSPWGYEISSRFIILASTIFPAVGCYFCIAYTYLFQIHRVINFQSDHCNGTPTALPPVSYSIGIWLPQKFFWLAVLMLHVPPRIIFTNMCQQYYFHAPNNQTSQPSSAYNVILRIHYYFMHSEMWALVGVSIMDIEYNFLIHATFFGIWLGTFNMNMLLNTILHYNSGLMTIGKKYVYIFRFKLFMFVFGCPFSLSSAASYLFYLHTCEDYAYIAFSVAEYVTVGMNALFYFLFIFDIENLEVNISVRQRKPKANGGIMHSILCEPLPEKFHINSMKNVA